MTSNRHLLVLTAMSLANVSTSVVHDRVGGHGQRLTYLFVQNRIKTFLPAGRAWGALSPNIVAAFENITQPHRLVTADHHWLRADVNANELQQLNAAFPNLIRPYDEDEHQAGLGPMKAVVLWEWVPTLFLQRMISTIDSVRRLAPPSAGNHAHRQPQRGVHKLGRLRAGSLWAA